MADALEMLKAARERQGSAVPSALEKLGAAQQRLGGVITTPIEPPEEPGPAITDPAGPMVLDVRETVPDIVKQAASAGVVYDKSAPGGHFLSSLAYGEDDRLEAYRMGIKQETGQDVDVRIGPETGAVEYFDQETGRFALASPPGGDLRQLGALGGAAIAVAPEAALGITTALATRSPALVALGGGAGAMVGEMARLYLGRDLGINKGLDDESILLAGLEAGGIAAGSGLVADKAMMFGRFLLDSMAGRVISPKQINAMGLEIEEAAAIQDEINSRLHGEQLRFNIAQASNDEDLLSIQERLRKDLESRRSMLAADRLQDEALSNFFEEVSQPYQTRADTDQVAQSIRGVGATRLSRAQGRESVPVQLARSDLENLTTSIKDRPIESFGRPLRAVGSQEQEVFNQETAKRVAEIDKLAGGAPIIRNNETAKAAGKLSQEQRDALFPFQAREKRRLVGQAPPEPAPGESLSPEEEASISAIFRPGAEFTFRQAWNAVSALKRLARISGKGLSTEEPAVGDINFLVGALEKDIAGSLQGSRLGEAYDTFKVFYQREKTRLDEGIVGRLMEREGGPRGRFAIADEKVFNEAFPRGGAREAQEIRNLIGSDPEAMQAVVESFGDLWKSRVLKGGRVDLRAHEKFLKDHGQQMQLFMSPEEFGRFRRTGNLESVLQAREAKETRALAVINNTLDAELAELKDVKSLLLAMRGSPEKTRAVVGALKQTPDVLRGLRAEYRKNLADRIAGQYVQGERLLSFKKLNDTLFGKGGETGEIGTIRALFGDQYAKDLQTLNKALQIAEREVKFPQRSMTPFHLKTLKNLARAYVGLFTRAGRMITAADQIRGRSANRVLVRALLNPEDLHEIVKLEGTDITSRKAAVILGQMGGSGLLPGVGEPRGGGSREE